MMNLDKLTKQIDALTYNSRSVLNALIRSTMTAGSYNGFTVVRGGETIVLTRTDIFRLYTFYQDWAYKVSYGTGDTFDELLAEHDSKYAGGNNSVSGTPTTDAVVKHAKILYQTDENVGNDDAYWVGLVRDNNNPKLITNSAPIPINIRTPIYDENLSTKHFDQFETFLFPNSYHLLDILGYQGDHIDHNAGGRNWIYNIDNEFSVDADKVLLGVHTKRIADIRAKCYMDQSPIHSVAYGVDSYAFGPNSLSGGLYNQTYGKNSVILGGTRNMVYGDNSAVLGGEYNQITGKNSLAGGRFNNVENDSSMAFGFLTAAGGGYPYTFTRYIVSPDEINETTCEPNEIITDDGCRYVLVANDGSAGGNGSNNGSSEIRSLGPNEVFVSRSEIDDSHIGWSRISSIDSSATGYWVDFKPNDLVVLYNFTTPDRLSYETNIGRMIRAKVTDISEVNGGVVITLDQNVIEPAGLGRPVLKGVIRRYREIGISEINNAGGYRTLTNTMGHYSVALNVNTIAGGIAQTVVGASNVELLRPYFIVGNGSSYIDKDSYRSNGLVVASAYSYMKASHYVGMGVSHFGTAGTENGGDSDDVEHRRYDEEYPSVYKYTGGYTYSISSDYEHLGLVRAYHECSQVTTDGSGLKTYRNYLNPEPYNENIGLTLSHKTGSVVIAAGADDTKIDDENDHWLPSYKENASTDYVSLHLWSSYVISTESVHAYINTKRLLDVEFGTLRLRGNTFGALTAEPTERGLMSHDLSNTNLGWTNTLTHAGFYYTQYNSNNRMPSKFVTSGIELGGHIVNSVATYKDTNNVDWYDIAQLILPGRVFYNPAYASNLTTPHIKFTTHAVANYGNRDAVGNHVDPYGNEYYLAEEIAYLSDVQRGTTLYATIEPGEAIILNGTQGYREEGDNFIGSTYPFTVTCDWYGYTIANSPLRDNNAPRTNFCDTGAMQTISNANPGKLTQWLDIPYFTLFLNGVGISPSQQARFFTTSSATTFGMAYVGFAPSDNLSYTFTSKSNSFRNYVSASSTGGLLEKLKTYANTESIQTSKHSRSTMNYSSPRLCDMYCTVIDSDSDSESSLFMRWVKLVGNISVMYTNGKLCVDFDFYPALYRAGVQPSSTTKSRVQILTFDAYTTTSTMRLPYSPTNPPLAFGGVEDKTSTDIFDEIHFNIPLSTAFTSHVRMAENPKSNVKSHMYGRAYFTNGQDICALGELCYTTPVFGHTTNDMRKMTRDYNQPCIAVTLSNVHLGGTQEFYHVHMEGDATYVQ